MALSVTLNDQVIFHVADGQSVLVPFDEDERTKAFHALTGALAVLAGITPLCQSYATEGAKDECLAENAQYPGGHRSGVVVPLRARQADQASD